MVTTDPAGDLSIEGRVISSVDGTPTSSDGKFLAVVKDTDPSGASNVIMHFSQPGCWEITGTVPGGSLTVTVLVLPPADEG